MQQVASGLIQALPPCHDAAAAAAAAADPDPATRPH
jgi:hypothetical protein